MSKVVGNLTGAPTLAAVGNHTWQQGAVGKLWAERKLMAHTPLQVLTVEGLPHTKFIFKDESKSITKNLKHRFTWCLFMWAVLAGSLQEGTPVYEASSGNTATSEAYMARLLGLPFTAVVPYSTEEAKIKRIESYGGKIIKTANTEMFNKAAELAKQNNGFYMNQFANAFRAEEFHESGEYEFESTNVFHEIIEQVKEAKYGAVDFFVHTAGTGGTITSVGSYVKKYGLPTKVVLADTQFSAYFDYAVHGNFKNQTGAPFWQKPGMEGTGFGYAGPLVLGVSTSLQPSVLDLAYKIPDLASTAGMHVLRERGVHGGTSTGVNFVASLALAANNRGTPTDPTNVGLILADGADIYSDTYFNTTWISTAFAAQGGLTTFNCWKRTLRNAVTLGFDPLPVGARSCKTPAGA